MPGDQNLVETSKGLAAIRAAEALLRTLGGCTIWVRIPISVTAAGDAAQLGLAASATQDIALSPVVVRHARNAKGSLKKLELLISASSLAQAKEIRDANGAEEFFNSALGVVYSGTLLRVESVLVDEFGG